MYASAHQLKNARVAASEGFRACVQQQTVWFDIKMWCYTVAKGTSKHPGNHPGNKQTPLVSSWHELSAVAKFHEECTLKGHKQPK